MLRKWILAGLLATGLTATGMYGVQAAVMDAAAPQRTVSVEGQAQRELVPNKAQMRFGIEGQGPDAKVAKEAYDQRMQSVVAALKAAGVKDKDLKTANFLISPVYAYPKDGTAPKIEAYRVTNEIVFETKDTALLSRVLDSVVSAGANTVSDVQFVVDQPQQLKNELLAEAIDNGRRTAQIIARAGQARLGRLMNASIASTNEYWPAPLMARASFDSAPSTPLFPGSQKVSMRVSLVFELVD